MYIFSTHSFLRQMVDFWYHKEIPESQSDLHDPCNGLQWFRAFWKLNSSSLASPNESRNSLKLRAKRTNHCEKQRRTWIKHWGFGTKTTTSIRMAFFRRLPGQYRHVRFHKFLIPISRNWESIMRSNSTKNVRSCFLLYWSNFWASDRISRSFCHSGSFIFTFFVSGSNHSSYWRCSGVPHNRCVTNSRNRACEIRVGSLCSKCWPVYACWDFSKPGKLIKNKQFSLSHIF